MEATPFTSSALAWFFTDLTRDRVGPIAGLMRDNFLSITDCVHEFWSFTNKCWSFTHEFLSNKDFLHFLLATTIQLSSLTTRAGGGVLVLVVAIASVGALDVGVGAGVLAPVVGVAETVLDVGVGAGVLAPVVGVAEVGVVRISIFSNPHRSNPVSSITLDTDSVGASSVVASATIFGHTFAS